MIDLENHIATQEADIFGKAGGLNFSDYSAAELAHAELMGQVRGELFSVYAELAGFFALAGLRLIAFGILREKLRTIRHRNSDFLGLLVPHVVELHRLPNGSLRDGIYKISAAMNGLAVYVGDHVTRLQAHFIRGAARFDGLDHNAVWRAQFLH